MEDGDCEPQHCGPRSAAPLVTVIVTLAENPDIIPTFQNLIGIRRVQEQEKRGVMFCNTRGNGSDPQA